MKLLRDTPLEAGFVVTHVAPPRPTLTVVVKATLRFDDRGQCTLAEAQRPVSGDAYVDDDPARPLVYASDLAALKPCGECWVHGRFRAPHGVAVAQGTAAFELGPVRRAVSVFGPRRWTGRLVRTLSDPTPVTEVPIGWDRAFGAPGVAENPFGIGLVASADGSVEAPQVEDPQHLVAGPDDRPPPAGFAPLPLTLPARLPLAGTYTGAWATTRWPWLPADFSPSFYLSSPEGQRIAGYWRGDEAFALRNLVEGAPLVRGALPDLQARVWIEAPDGQGRALPMQLDTVVVDSDAREIVLLWRAVLSVRDDALDEIAALYVTHDLPESPARALPLDARLAAFRAALAAEEAGFAAEPIPELDPDLLAEPAPPPDPPPTPESLEAERAANDLPDLPEAPPGPDTPEAAEEALKAACAAAGTPYEPPPSDDPAEPPEPPLRARVEAALGRGESLAGWDCADGDLSGMSLAGVDFTGALLTGCNLTGCDLTGAVLAEVSAGGAVLVGATLTEATLAKGDFTGARFDDAPMGRLRGAHACLDGASMARIAAHEADLTGASMIGAVLDGALLDGAVLDGADLAGASLVGARLRGAGLSKCCLEGAKAAGADLTDAVMVRVRAGDGVGLAGAVLRGVKAEHGVFGDADLRGAELAYGEFARADFGGAVLEDAVMDGCDLRRARFHGAKMARVMMRRADALEAVFEGADLTGADLRGASCHGAAFWKAQTAGVQTALALLTGTLLAGRPG